MVDVSRKFGIEDRQAVDLIRKADTPALLVLNKTDLLHKDKGTLLPLIEQYRALNEFADYIPLSARSGEGLPELRQAIVARLPDGPAYFPPDFITDQPDRFLAAELIREKILDVTREEVPHSVAVAVDAWEDTPELIRIYATILCGARRPERHHYWRGRRHAEADRHARETGNGTALRPPRVFEPARQSKGKLARAARLPGRPRLAYNGRSR